MIKKATKAGFGGILFLVLIVFFSTNAMADLKMEYQASTGYTDNLYSDSTFNEDSYEIGKVTLKTYPISFMEVKLQAENTFYNILSDLTNFAGTAELTALPLKKSSPLSIYINSGFTKREYSYNFSSVNTDDFKFNLSLARKISSTINARAGFSFKNTNYAETEDTSAVQHLYDISRDTRNWELFFGTNIILGRSNTIDIEVGFERTYLEYVEYPTGMYSVTIDDSVHILPKDFINPNFDKATEGNYDAYYFSTRYSRPIGKRTGFNISFAYSKFNDVDNMVIPPLLNDFLSPWVSYYEGFSISSNIKTFIIPNYTISAGAGYWDKNFLQTQEARIGTPYALTVIKDRFDDQLKFYFGIKRTFVFKEGYEIEASLQLDYSDNESTNYRYYYNNKSIAFGITCKM